MNKEVCSQLHIPNFHGHRFRSEKIPLPLGLSWTPWAPYRNRGHIEYPPEFLIYYPYLLSTPKQIMFRIKACPGDGMSEKPWSTKKSREPSSGKIRKTSRKHRIRVPQYGYSERGKKMSTHILRMWYQAYFFYLQVGRWAPPSQNVELCEVSGKVLWRIGAKTPSENQSGGYFEHEVRRWRASMTGKQVWMIDVPLIGARKETSSTGWRVLLKVLSK